MKSISDELDDILLKQHTDQLATGSLTSEESRAKAKQAILNLIDTRVNEAVQAERNRILEGLPRLDEKEFKENPQYYFGKKDILDQAKAVIEQKG